MRTFLAVAGSFIIASFARVVFDLLLGPLPGVTLETTTLAGLLFWALAFLYLYRSAPSLRIVASRFLRAMPFCWVAFVLTRIALSWQASLSGRDLAVIVVSVVLWTLITIVPVWLLVVARRMILLTAFPPPGGTR